VSAIIGYNSDVIFLSDLRLNGKDRIALDKFRLKYKVYFNSSKNSRGVAVLISLQVEHEILDTVNDQQENFILLHLKLNGIEMIIGSVYGPNADAGANQFYDDLKINLGRWPEIPCVIGGDWNATYSNEPVNVNPDVLFMQNIPSKIRSDLMLDMCADRGLSDPFRILNPDEREFSYNPSGDLRKNRSRIDFFLVSECIYRFVDKCTISQGYCRKSFDHKPIFLSLKTKKRGNGRAVVNNRVIDNKHAYNIVKIAVYLTYLSACIPILGQAGKEIMRNEVEKIKNIKDKVNAIILLEVTGLARDLTDDEADRMRVLGAEVAEDWEEVMPLDELEEWERQVTDDFFFEQLLLNTRSDLMALQQFLAASEKKQVREWATKVAN
jgi:exonuclease III